MQIQFIIKPLGGLHMDLGNLEMLFLLKYPCLDVIVLCKVIYLVVEENVHSYKLNTDGCYSGYS